MIKTDDTKPRTLKDRVVAQLRQRIISRSVDPGAVLGTQEQLVKDLGVSRPILREAIQELSTLGLLRSVQKVGVVVTKPNPLNAFEAAAELTTGDAEDMFDLFEARYALEVGAVDHVVAKITDPQVDALEALAAKYSRLTRDQPNDPKQLEATDCQFHCDILAVSGNPWLMRMHRVIIAYFDRCIAIALAPDGQYELNPQGYAEHEMIVHALRQRNIELTRQVLVSHLRTAMADRLRDSRFFDETAGEPGDESYSR